MTNLTIEKLLEASKMLKMQNREFFPKIIVDDHACIQTKRIQFRFPKRKNHRLRKKFFKNPKNWKIVTEEYIYQTPLGMVVSKRFEMSLKQQGVKNDPR